MIFDVNGEPLVGGVEARALGDRPACKHAIELEAEVVVEIAGGVLLHDETRTRAALRPGATPGLGRPREVALAAVVLETHEAHTTAAESMPRPNARTNAIRNANSRNFCRGRGTDCRDDDGSARLAARQPT